MRIKISVPEVVSLIKGIQKEPARIFEMATMNVQKGELSMSMLR